MPSERPLADTASDLAGQYECIAAVPGNTRMESLTLEESGFYRYQSIDFVPPNPSDPDRPPVPPFDISDFPPETTMNRQSASGMWSVDDEQNVPVVKLVATPTVLEEALTNMSLAVVDGNLVVLTAS